MHVSKLFHISNIEMNTIDLDQFISDHVIQRETSFFHKDLEANRETLRKSIEGKSVLVIGGAGTIGSSFTKELVRYAPGKLVVVDINESGLTELVRDLRSTLGLPVPDDFKLYPVDFGSKVFERILRTNGKFDIVANFAAHKHVRSEKDAFSVEAMIENNLVKAKKLLDMLAKNPPEHFFCVSTDKAANPINIMGATKKIMEDLILWYSSHMNVTTARFANVAFSNGSLPFGFLQRIMKKQPLSSPSDVRRYFVSPEESGQICLLACILGSSGQIFFPKLDSDVHLEKFSTIAERLLASLGMSPVYTKSEEEARLLASQLGPESTEYPVYFFDTNTTGEKMFEVFYTDEEDVDFDTFESLGVVRRSPDRAKRDLDGFFDQLNEITKRDVFEKAELVDLFRSHIDSFQHEEKSTNLDQRM